MILRKLARAYTVFMGGIYAWEAYDGLKKAGIDTAEMSPDEVIGYWARLVLESVHIDQVRGGMGIAGFCVWDTAVTRQTGLSMDEYATRNYQPCREYLAPAWMSEPPY